MTWDLEVAIRDLNGCISELNQTLNRMMMENKYLHYLREIEGLMDASPGSSEEERLSRLVDWVVEYEERHYPMGGTP